ncbi:UNVERIFIED_CONTAM: hypothetical protein FKN15_033192 [Acipenser sinensis]
MPQEESPQPMCAASANLRMRNLDPQCKNESKITNDSVLMLGITRRITRRDRKRKEWIRAQKVRNVIIRAKKTEMAVWAGHVARRKDHRWTKEILD